MKKSRGKSDGTANGTQVIDVRNGSNSIAPSYIVVVGNMLYFKGYQSSNGYELWMSDGTLAGTMMVKDINPGSSSSTPSYLTGTDNMLYCNANDGTNGVELWGAELAPDGSGVKISHAISYS